MRVPIYSLPFHYREPADAPSKDMFCFARRQAQANLTVECFPNPSCGQNDIVESRLSSDDTIEKQGIGWLHLAWLVTTETEMLG